MSVMFIDRVSNKPDPRSMDKWVIIMLIDFLHFIINILIIIN